MFSLSFNDRTDVLPAYCAHHIIRIADAKYVNPDAVVFAHGSRGRIHHLQILPEERRHA